MRSGKFTRVRYLRISRMSLEIVQGLSAETKAIFLEQCLEWFLKLEKGEEIEMVDTGNVLLNVALREEIAELQEGFAKYMQSVEARSRGKIDDISANNPDDIGGLSAIHPTEEEQNQEYEQEKRKTSSSGKETPKTGTPFSNIEKEALQSQLNYFGIHPDEAFWNTAQKYGYRATMDSIRQAKESGCTSIKQITKMIREYGMGA